MSTPEERLAALEQQLIDLKAQYEADIYQLRAWHNALRSRFDSYEERAVQPVVQSTHGPWSLNGRWR